MKIYADELLTQELIEVLPLGIVPAGEVRQFIFWIENNSFSYLKNIKININHDEIKIIESPNHLLANEVKKMIIEWNCTIELKQGLNVPIEITADEIVG